MFKKTQKIILGLLGKEDSMKLIKRRFSLLLATVLMLTLLMGVNVMAYTPSIDFDPGTISLHTGEHYSFQITSSGNFVYYVVGNKSKHSAVDFTGAKGTSTATIYIGEDETSDRVMFAFYVDGYDCHKEVYVNVIKEKQTVTVNNNGTSSSGIVPITLVDGTSGVLTTQNAGYLGVFGTTTGIPLAAFTVNDSKGNLQKITVRPTMVFNGCFYLGVNVTPTYGKLNITISQADIQRLANTKIAGLYLNGQYVNFI